MDVKPVHEVDSTGGQYWMVDGKYHREDGPAIIWADGTQVWCADGKYHRAAGPSIIWADGTQVWCANGPLHRIDGPAVIRADDTQEWWINGKNISGKVEQWMELKKISWPFDELTQVEFLLSWT